MSYQALYSSRCVPLFLLDTSLFHLDTSLSLRYNLLIYAIILLCYSNPYYPFFSFVILVILLWPSI